MIVARNEPLFNQPIDGHTDGTGSEPDFRADRVHREGTLIQEDFQDAEIGVAQFCALDAAGRVREERLKGLHQNKPDMDAGGVLLFEGSFRFHEKIVT